MNIYLKAAVYTVRTVIMYLSIMLVFIGVFAFNFFIISRYVLEINKVLPTLSIFIIGLLSIIAMALEMALVMLYFEKVKKLKANSVKTSNK